MLIKYDAKVQRWIATVTVDGSPCVIVSHSMLRAMQLAAWLVCAPPAGQLVQRELALIDGTCTPAPTCDKNVIGWFGLPED